MSSYSDGPLPICTGMGNPLERTQDLLIFHLSGLKYAFPLDAVREVVPMATLSSPPGLPSGLAGFLDLRGTAIHLERLLDIAEPLPGLHTPMTVLRGVRGPIGILVDSVRGIVPVSSTRLLEIPEDGTFQDCATAALELDGDLIHVLSPSALLEASEVGLLAEYRAMSQARLLHLLPTPGGEGGASGLLAICRSGGYTLAEEESTAVVYGMPAAVRMRAACESLPLAAIAPRVLDLVSCKAS